MGKNDGDSVSTTVRLPRDTYEWLKARPEGISDSIKRGLELLAIEEQADEATREFALAVFNLAREVDLELDAKWQEDVGAHRVFRRMLLRAISKWRPAGYDPFETVTVTSFQKRPHATQPIDDADELGIALADRVIGTPDPAHRARTRAAQEETLKEIVKFQQTRGEEGHD